jgi:hypothetical protein
MEIKKFGNSLIAFDFDSEMVNATDLVSAYNKSNGTEKRIDNYFRQKSTDEFITALKSDTLISAIDNQIVKKVKNQYGKTAETWVNKWIAYDLAAWLSPKFRLFVYQVFDNAVNEKLRNQQMQLDYFWDKEDQRDLYNKK